MSLSVFLRLFAVLACFAFASAGVRADEKSDLATLDSIQTLSDRDNTEGLIALQNFYQHLSAETSNAVRLQALKLLLALYYDAGKIKQADATIAQLLEFSRQQHNDSAYAQAQIFSTLSLLDDGKPDQALTQLLKIQESIKSNSDPEVNFRIHSALGSVYKIQGKFEESLRHFLEALRLADLQPRRVIQARFYRLEALANLYMAMKDPQRALATTQEAQALSSMSNAPKIYSSVLIQQGLALSMLNRNDEAQQAFQRVLKIGAEAKIPSIEVNALINLSDQHLISHQFKQAEQFARDALTKGDGVVDSATLAIARVNLGFALCGQGKISQGTEYIHQVLKFFRDSGSKVELEGITGELASMYEAAGMYKEALLTLRQQQKVTDELFQSNRAQAVAALQEQFKAEQRQKQIELLGKDNSLKDAEIQNRHLGQVITLLAMIIALMAGAFTLFLYRRVSRVNKQLQHANSQLEFHAVRDPLTGLHNRRSFVELMKARSVQISQERRESNSAMPDCLILMDIDHFKHVNDTWGHAAGDVVLKEIAARLKHVVREKDMVMRWGGEEFLIFAPDSNPMQISNLVERVLHSVGDTPFQFGMSQIAVTVTAGFISLPFAQVPEQQCDWEKSLQIADMALYMGKTHGRNRAYGLDRLLVPYEKALPVLDHDLAAAISAGMVEVIEVIGPVQTSERLLRQAQSGLSQNPPELSVSSVSSVSSVLVPAVDAISLRQETAG